MTPGQPGAAGSGYGGYGITDTGPATGDVAHDLPPGPAPYGQVGGASAFSAARPEREAAQRQAGLVETGESCCPRRWTGTSRCRRRRPCEDISRLYGQIAIYTLLDETADDFERLASEVVDQVKTREPDTLVYVMHGVPAAPMQRILYAVYRDEAAFDEHERQPYIRQFEEEREQFVLATNVIELGVRHAKFTPPRPRASRGRGRSGRAAACPLTRAAAALAGTGGADAG